MYIIFLLRFLIKYSTMVAVIFEALPHTDQWDHYLDLAAQLRPELQKIEGFLSIERYQSLTNAGKVLSLSFWQDEESVTRWRNVELHRQAQYQGRTSVFQDYRIRVATVSRDYSLHQRMAAPDDSQVVHQEKENHAKH
jgi:heme-degrading monooxygenase HmoA